MPRKGDEMFRPMKPETTARRRAEHARRRAEQKEESIARLRKLVERDGPDSIWGELLDEAMRRVRVERC